MRLLLAVLGSVILLTSCLPAMRKGGSATYSPTALEWAWVVCQTVRVIGQETIYPLCKKEEPDTISIMIIYTGDTTKERAEEKFMNIKSTMASHLPAEKGWSWLKITMELKRL